MRKTLFLLYILTLSLHVNAQPRFVPEHEIMKVGDIMFQQPKHVVFGFTNKGDKPLKITEVHPACDCTKVKYTQADIMPGERGEIEAVYDANMLGTFSKDLIVLTNARKDPYYLTIQGHVATSVTDYAGDFPFDLGNIRLSTNYIEFDNVNRGDHPVAEFQVVNTEKTAFRPEIMHLPPFLTAVCLPQDIPGGKIGRIRLILDSEKLETLGLNQTSIYLARYLGDKVSESNEILVSSVLLPDFSNLNADQISKAPKMSISETDVDMGAMGTKKKLSHTVLVTNNGLSPLTIKQVQVFNRALGVSLGNRTLKPGKSTKLKISVDAELLKSAKARPRVLLISDDPRNPMETVNITVKP